ncbi:MAG: iron-sulfur cluster-binding domain-containing protein [Bacteroidetes bacterium]|nr:iron-sulfur cluster-binding domain-containing protein [Bacteroidota bacterium]
MTSYTNLEVISVKSETKETILLTLKSTGGNLINFSAGQFLTIFFSDGEKEIKRAFSICSSPDELPIITLAIKSDSPGPTHDIFLKNIHVGDNIKALPPLGHFTLDRLKGRASNLFFIGAGSGIAPLYSMLKWSLPHNPEYKHTLIYGNKDETSVIFKNELELLEKQHTDSFSLYLVYSRPLAQKYPRTGRINEKTITDILKSFSEYEVKNSNYFMCGPSDLMKKTRAILISIGVKDKNIHSEDFVVKILDENDTTELKEREVTIIVDGNKYEFNVDPNKSIMTAAKDNGITLPCKCTEGKCGTCKAKLLSGVLKLKGQKALKSTELNNDNCLTCVGFPASEDVVIFYDD